MLLTFLLALSFGNATKLLHSSYSTDLGERRRMQANGLGVFAVGDSVLVDGEEAACIASIVDSNQGVVTLNYADGITFGEETEVDRLSLVEAGVGCPEGEPTANNSSDDSEETFGSEEDTAMVKLCLFYSSPSGHARTDPIISQTCASDHMHTFYGPLHLHPATTYEDLISTPPQFSTSPVEENQSNYWHPSIYRRRRSDGEAASFELVTNLEVGPYYRWDNSVSPATVAYPPGFRMIAHYPSSDPGAQGRMMTECCMLTNDDEVCEEWPFLHFPDRKCDFVGIALGMPSCWDGVELGDQNNHVDHMRYTTNGEVAGPCPSDFPVRLPELQLFVRILNYDGADFQYQLSTGSVGADSEGNGDNQNWHVDFMNGWKEGTIQTLIDNCPIPEQAGYNPYCECLHTNDGANALPNDITLRPREFAHEPLCEDDVRSVIIDEATHNVAELPRGSCQGPPLKERSYTTLSDSLFPCASSAPTDGREPDSPTACVDDDELAIETASAQGQTIGGCSDAIAWCGVVPEVSEICPVTCGVCSNVETTKPIEEAEEEEGEEEEALTPEPSTTAPLLLTTEPVVANPSRARMEELQSIYQRKPNALRWAAVSSLVDLITQEFPSMEARVAKKFEQQQNLLERSFSKKRWRKSKKAFKQALRIMTKQGEF